MITATDKARIMAPFVIPNWAWENSNTDIAQTVQHIPAQVAPSVKSVNKRSFWNAETYAYCLMYLGPIVLKGCLYVPYYRHFVELNLNEDAARCRESR
jgi:hypothetical protein